MEISKRLQNALVADDVDDEEDPEEVHRLIHVPLDDVDDSYEITARLGRQLRFRSGHDGPGGIHDTLMALVPLLEQLLKDWPLPEDGKAAETLADIACRNLNAFEVYATLLAGPPKWRTRNVPASSVEKLPDHLRPILLRGFTQSLNEMLARWAKMNVPGLYSKWMEERSARQEKERIETLEQRRATQRESRPERERDPRFYDGFGFVPTYRPR